MANRDDRDPYFVPAECFSGCEDPKCPYIHSSGWMIDGVEGLHATEMEAVAAQIRAARALRNEGVG